MKPLPEILKQVKSSAAVRLLEKDLKDLKENFDEIGEYLKNRLSTNTKQKTKAIQNIKAMRKSIDDYINQLEQQLFKDLETEHLKLKSQIETLLHEVDIRAKQIRKLQNEFSNMTKYATELQTYVGLTEIETITSKETNYMEDLKRGPDLNERNLHVTTSPDFDSILLDVKSFGEITVDTRPCNILANAGRKYQAQHLVPIPTIDQIKPSFSKTLKVPGGKKCDHKVLLMIRNDGTFIRSILSFKEVPTCVCLVKDDTVAVSFYSAGQVALVDIGKNKDIDTPLGIALDKNEFIFVACKGSNKIVVISPDGKSCRTILNHDNGINYPLSVDIDMKSGIMLVVSGVDSLLFKL
ncbi:unnamed protein product [Mytilus edulis]|uniref:Uncharacterized protein n=1 Tax=Mytilus edulis TaxID=6550 RepID=A0A8S3Q1E2_MYTED|nr:unnamed protein product [Mytilus edulis]